MDKQKYELIAKIAKRADDMKLQRADRMSLMMDLECADKVFNLRLDDFLKADSFNFAHDVCEIQQNIDRQTKTFKNSFLPRYSNYLI